MKEYGAYTRNYLIAQQTAYGGLHKHSLRLFALCVYIECMPLEHSLNTICFALEDCCCFYMHNELIEQKPSAPRQEQKCAKKY